MSAGDLFKAGKLSEAIAAQTEEVRSHPADQARRLFLFELLAFSGDLERARRQIEVVRYEEAELETATQKYRTVIDSEEARRRLFRDGMPPKFLMEPPAHVASRLEAVNQLRAGHLAEAATVLAKAETPELRGQLNDKPFEGLRDADDLFATVLEVFANGAYYWVPLEQIVSLTMNAPRFPRDLLWVPARLELSGTSGDVFLPALYPGSHEHPDEQIKLGRATDWKNTETGPILGVGLRTYLAGEDGVSLLEWRRLELAAG
jgi:type VI secretion system protein ImpE